jgi:phosphoribulokinase
MRMREPYFKRYIDFQKIYADIVIKIKNSEFNEESSYLVETIYKSLDFPLSGIDMRLSLSSLMNRSEKPFSMKYRKDFYYMKDVSRISFDGLIDRDAIRSIESRIMEYTGFTENYLIGESEYVNAIQLTQILVVWYFVEMMTNIFREIDRVSGGN